jgi:hypothetical protein
MCLPTNTTSSNISIKKSAVADSSNTKKANKKRRLTFAPEISKVIGTVISREDYTFKEKKSCWWSAKERSKLRTHSTQHLILTIRERGQECTRLIDDSLEVAQSLSASLAAKEVDSLLKGPSNYTTKLEAWTLNGQDFRGLERSLSVLQQERTATAREIRGNVLNTQRMGVSGEEAAEDYAEQSLASRIYARWMGDADYSSVYCSAYFL